ncbi:S-methyl-5'-thioadenosine phosphorylase [Pyrinomonas methylaliphatogenes]|jgi:5'-methylthioadenosine phosphorylase|uniref:S-methyl-5'-thioadenosine phosphorylase n=1 Tax=Pyrinomonas methylaliphatogenes TaxID=454194 RepID=A0A0B6WVA6_9BACT|nr:S-methyl-5'-thioadenosine phosphorylase [Pyrinomonas methylaliphatogenes]MBX5480031.1 S-methyl-5'-thioadenosine phosphorylase [Pyrinomonas methylaliphatogenes]CDM64204.1 methylthioadenosine phosphorylase [Pyrinomonas methylaliphatogenes]
MAKAQIGIIGGSGLYQMPELTDVEEVRVETPFGDPSDAFIIGTLEGVRVAFLPRHGRGHRILPTELPFRANIYALKLLGVERILSASAVGSLQERYAPLDMVIPDQFFDRTRARARESTFFGDGIVAHISFAHPVCSDLGDVLEESCRAVGVNVHRGGTYLCMEGPAFSTKAESNVYRAWGMDVIGMTNLQEAKLAREAEICYATLALVTDYDCWHESHDVVTVETVVENLNKNVRHAQLVMREAVKRLQGRPRACECGSALKNAIFTAPELWPEATTKRLEAIIGKYKKAD